MESNDYETPRFVIAETFTQMIGQFIDYLLMVQSLPSANRYDALMKAKEMVINIGGPLPDTISIELPSSDRRGLTALELLRLGKRLWEPRWFFAGMRNYPNWLRNAHGEIDPDKVAARERHAETMSVLDTRLGECLQHMVEWSETVLREVHLRMVALFLQLFDPPPTPSKPSPPPPPNGSTEAVEPLIRPKAQKLLEIAAALELEEQIKGNLRELEQMPVKDVGDAHSRMCFAALIPQSRLPEVCQWPEFVEASEESVRRFGKPLDALAARMLSAEVARKGTDAAAEREGTNGADNQAGWRGNRSGNQSPSVLTPRQLLFEQIRKLKTDKGMTPATIRKWIESPEGKSLREEVNAEIVRNPKKKNGTPNDLEAIVNAALAPTYPSQDSNGKR
jgi:hypothetical protein